MKYIGKVELRQDGSDKRKWNHIRRVFAKQGICKYGPYSEEYSVKSIEQNRFLIGYFRSVIEANQMICATTVSIEVTAR